MFVLTYNEETKNDRFALFENPIVEKIDPFDHLHPLPLPLQVPSAGIQNYTVLPVLGRAFRPYWWEKFATSENVFQRLFSHMKNHCLCLLNVNLQYKLY
jgi:hypothetical protein